MAQTPPDKKGFFSVLERAKGDHPENTSVYNAIKTAFEAAFANTQPGGAGTKEAQRSVSSAGLSS
jgi:hypothetical protein